MSGLIRPIGLLDIPLISRLQHQGIQLDLRRALTLPESPLAVALRAPLALGNPPAYTYIGWQDQPANDQMGFVQLRSRQCERPQADITYIAPTLDTHVTSSALWTRLLNAVCWEAAIHGIQQVFADLPADSENVTPFLNAGFVIFAREDILGCDQLTPAKGTSNIPVRPQTDSDTPDLQRLYAAIVPVGVKQAEGAFEVTETHSGPTGRPSVNGYVFERDGEIAGHVNIFQGKIGHRVQFTVRPDSPDLAQEVVAAGLQLLSEMPAQPVFCHIRTYQSCLKPALMDRGFKVIDVRDIAVRQTLARVGKPALSSMTVLDSRSEVSVTPSLSPHWQQAKKRKT